MSAAEGRKEEHGRFLFVFIGVRRCFCTPHKTSVWQKNEQRCVALHILQLLESAQSLQGCKQPGDVIEVRHVFYSCIVKETEGRKEGKRKTLKKVQEEGWANWG